MPKLGIDKLYEERTNFTVIALTGYTATGCSYLAEIMQKKDFYKDVRKPDEIKSGAPNSTDNNKYVSEEDKLKNKDALATYIFKRKYTICYDYISENYVPFVKISYTRVLWLKVLLQAAAEENSESFKKSILTVVDDKFKSGRADKDYAEKYDVQNVKGKVLERLSEWDKWTELYSAITNIKAKREEDPQGYDSDLADTLVLNKESITNEFISFVNQLMSEGDYYCYCFFYHRLGSQIRKCGDAFAPYDEVYDKTYDDDSHLYDIVLLINRLIKGIRHKRDHCRVVIDRLRNSLEARYLRERYSAFYLVAIHDEDNPYKNLRDKLKSNYPTDDEYRKNESKIEDQVKKVLHLGDVEAESDEVEKGSFYSPNVSQCVADAEIHLSNNRKKGDYNYFASIDEQWLKFAALIQHPGLITPSSEERCMVVAYTAKFNSGCLSRQVGAVITNKAHSIRTIGWNDVPYGQIPCSLRNLFDFGKDDISSLTYSAFETSERPYYDEKESFRQRVRRDYQFLGHPEKFRLNGLPFSYCFKTLHNRYSAEKNQVFTRSLHAEENAMMQMVRFGGESLEDGVIYVTASPCELCCKKLYQIGIRKIVYIDEYPGISREHIIAIGYKRPDLKQFQGAYGATYFKLYQPIMAYKDELEQRISENKHSLITSSDLLKKIAKNFGFDIQSNYTEEEVNQILSKISDARIQKRSNGKVESGELG